MDTKTFSSIVKLKPAEGRVTADILRWDVPDKAGDVVVRGSLTDSLKDWRSSNALIPIQWNHESGSPLDNIGHVNPHNVQETATGLIISGQLYLDEERGAKAYQMLKRGTLREWSFGCLVQSSRPREGGGRDLLKLHLFEVSPTFIGKGTTETLMVASASALPSPSPLTFEEQLAPFRARLDIAQQRVARARRS